MPEITASLPLLLPTALLATTLLLSLLIYRLYFHPLSHIPGPLLPKLTSLWLHHRTYTGTECTAIRRLHHIYGPVVRIAPNEVDVSDGSAIARIYGARSDLVKSSHYEKFTMDNHATVFATRTSLGRASRLKAMYPLFSARGISEVKGVIEGCVGEFVARLQGEKKARRGDVDVLNLAEAFATDVTSAWLFGERHKYGALKEITTTTPFSAAGYFDDFLAVGRFFYLPMAVWVVLEWVGAMVFPDSKREERRRSMKVVDEFCERVVRSAASEVGKDEGGSFQERLLEQGTSLEATAVECKDAIFAGGYLIGMVVAQIMWFLVKNPDKYADLREEIFSVKANSSDINAQSLPYLQYVVKEGLRLAMLSPARLPRIVSSAGLTVQGHYLPLGTNVGIGAFQLHTNPEVFPDPEKFLPERWENTTPEMRRDWVPFGFGVRSCIGRGFSIAAISEAVKAVVEANVLAGARAVQDRIEVKEWTISKLDGSGIMMVWGA